MSKPAEREDVWIEWAGGRLPVPRGTIVDVQYRDGGRLLDQVAGEQTGAWRDAYCSFWVNDNHHSDIIAYRIVFTSPEPADTLDMGGR